MTGIALKPIKCLVWDLDDVVWAGSLLEGYRGELRAGVRAAITDLDARGVLQSIARASDPDESISEKDSRDARLRFAPQPPGWCAT